MTEAQQDHSIEHCIALMTINYKICETLSFSGSLSFFLSTLSFFFLSLPPSMTVKPRIWCIDEEVARGNLWNYDKIID